MMLLLLACKGGAPDSALDDTHDEGPCEEQAWYLDQDGDGLGDGDEEDVVTVACEPPEAQGYATTWGDCYDLDAAVGAEGIFLIDADGVQDLAEAASLDSPHELVVEQASTLVVCDGVWSLSVESTAPLTVVGESLDSSLSGGGVARLLTLRGAPLTVEQVTLRDGHADNGGAIWTNDSVTLSYVVVRDSVAAGAGGGIYQTGADGLVAIDTCGIHANTAGTNGGGLLVEGSLELDNCRVSNNAAVQGGGGMQLTGLGTSTIHWGEVDTNTADRGGGIDLRPPHRVTLDGDSSVAYNTASFGGGFATWETARLDCLDSTIKLNVGDTKGGGAWLLPTDGATALTSSGCDWGEDEDDNTRTDVHNTQTAYVGTDGNWECVGTSCDLEEVD